ncbi:MAG: DUF2914 domain-containing protein [Pseudobdellovibrio sp.]
MFAAGKQKILATYKKYDVRFDILFFIGGFAFDAFLVSDIDDLFSLAQQAMYLFIIATFLHHEILFRLHKWRPPEGLLGRVWTYRNPLLHFLLGTLLNIYSLFYIKSASLISSLIFLMLMVGLIIANEFPLVKNAKVSLKMGLFSICLFSYMSIIFPVILGFLGWIPFVLAIATTLVFFYLQFWFLKRQLSDSNVLFDAVLLPSISVLTLFALFYVLGWIPPIPLSVKEQGIYHLVEKKDSHWFLSTEKEWWKFWQSGDQVFKARPQDIIYFYSQIYSPARFSDQIFIQWLRKDPIHGWQKTDRIPMQIVGGRKEGFRGFASKSNYQAGQWRVQVETAMGHEISRLDFEVIMDSSSDLRNFKVLIQ